LFLTVTVSLFIDHPLLYEFGVFFDPIVYTLCIHCVYNVHMYGVNAYGVYTLYGVNAYDTVHK
jgi:hypothetical protein